MYIQRDLRPSIPPFLHPRYSLTFLAAQGDTLQPWGYLGAYNFKAKDLELREGEIGPPASLFALGVPPRPLQ
jgi:hypothetical protein